MNGYKDCPIEQFNEAMRVVHENIPLQTIPTNLLYIAFDKYRADENRLRTVASSSYSKEILWRTRKKKEQLGVELKRRGIEVQI